MRILECRLEGGGVGILYQLQAEGLCLWGLGLQDEQLEGAGMALGGKDGRGEATGTREVLGILKMRSKLELHTKKLREGVCYGVEAAPEDSQPAGSASFGEEGAWWSFYHLCSSPSRYRSHPTSLAGRAVACPAGKTRCQSSVTLKWELFPHLLLAFL